MARGKVDVYPEIDDQDTRLFYETQFHLAAATQRTPEQWRDNAELWRWLSIGLTLGIVSPEYVVQMLGAETMGGSIDPKELGRLKSWVMSEISLSIDRTHRGLPNIHGAEGPRH